MSTVQEGLGGLKDISMDNGPNPIQLFVAIREVMVFGCKYLQDQVLQYIPRNKHTVSLCFALLWLCNRSEWILMKYSSIFIRVALLALGQS